MPQLSFEHAALQPSPIALPGPALVPSVPYYGFPDAEPGFELEVPRDVCAAALTAPTDDSIELFALGADRAVWSRTRVAGRWRAWRPLTPQTGAPWATSGPAAAVDASGDVHVLVRGPDGRLWHAQQGGAGTAVEGDGAWSAWSPAGNLTVAGNGGLLVAAGGGKLHALALGADRAVWHAAVPPCCDPARWAWSSLGGVWASKPAAAVDGRGALRVLAVSADDRNAYATAIDGGAGSAWARVGGGPLASVPKISMLPTGSGGVIAVARGADRAFLRAKLADNSTSWGRWGVLKLYPEGGWTSGAALLPQSGMEPELFATGSDLGVYHHTLRATHLHSMGGRFSATPSVLRNADGMLEVYVRGFDGRLWLRRQNNTGALGECNWDSWMSIGGSFLPFDC